MRILFYCTPSCKFHYADSIMRILLSFWEFYCVDFMVWVLFFGFHPIVQILLCGFYLIIRTLLCRIYSIDSISLCKFYYVDSIVRVSLYGFYHACSIMQILSSCTDFIMQIHYVHFIVEPQILLCEFHYMDSIVRVLSYRFHCTNSILRIPLCKF